MVVMVAAPLDDHHLVAAVAVTPAVMVAAVVVALDDDLLDGGRLRGRHRRDERNAENGRERKDELLHRFLHGINFAVALMRMAARTFRAWHRSISGRRPAATLR